MVKQSHNNINTAIRIAITLCHRKRIRAFLICLLSIFSIFLIFVPINSAFADATLEVISTIPIINTVGSSTETEIDVTFNNPILGSSISANTFIVVGSLSGRKTGSFSGAGTTIISFLSDTQYCVGEIITITITSGLKDIYNNSLPNAFNWQFIVEVPQGYANFYDTNQTLGTSASFDIALGDLDKDGDLDAFVANSFNQSNKVWLNNGNGIFMDSGQLLGNSSSEGVSLGDIDNDGDLDAFIANTEEQSDMIWLNDGLGNFTDSGQRLGNTTSLGVELGDLDGDGDLDAFVSSPTPYYCTMWINNGNGFFTSSGQAFPNMVGIDVALGDVDNDGDLDAFIACHYPEALSIQGSRLLLNDGHGYFSDSGQLIAASSSYGVSLGDLDGDGDLDAFISNISHSDKVCLNNGAGIFTDSGQQLGDMLSHYSALGDLDGDGDLDAYAATYAGTDMVWLNNGSGNFTNSGQFLIKNNSMGIALGDLDNDGDLDVATAEYFRGNQVWLNELLPATITTLSATKVGATIVTLNGNLDSLETATMAYVSFEWGTSSNSYTGETTPSQMSATGAFSFDLQNLSSNTTYYYRAKAVGDGTTYGNEKNFATLLSGCFIATAAYDSYLVPHLDILRDFRDSYLITNGPGRDFVNFYYTNSPPIARYITKHPWLKAPIRAALVPVVQMAAVVLKIKPVGALVILGFLIAIVVLFVFRMRRQSL